MTVVDEYLQKLPSAEQVALERIRTIVLTMAPDAEESISYGMPAFKYQGRPLVYFSSFKDHLSLFPTSGPTESLKNELQDFKVSKGTIQFTLDKQLPESLIRKIIQHRLTDITKNQK
jgi:uncharacterized protein YdhG (YjbR/CyaY superfamily)